MATGKDRMSRLEKPFVQRHVADLMFPVPQRHGILENEPWITRLWLGEQMYLLEVLRPRVGRERALWHQPFPHQHASGFAVSWAAAVCTTAMLASVCCPLLAVLLGYWPLIQLVIQNTCPQSLLDKLQTNNVSNKTYYLASHGPTISCPVPNNL